MSRYIKYPPEGGEYRSVAVLMDRDTLLALSEEQNLRANRPYTGEPVLTLKPNNLFKNYIESLAPYLNRTREISMALTTLKVKEAVMILVETNPALKNVLFDFSEPGKIDLEGFMNGHYRYNVDLTQIRH